MRRSWGAAVGVITALALTGCTRPETGRPVAADRPAANPTDPTKTTNPTNPTNPTKTVRSTSRTGGPGATRPRPIDLTAVDPCALLRDLRPADFGIDMEGAGTGGVSYAFPGSPDCFASGLRANIGIGVTAVRNLGVDTLVDGANAQVARADVAGYRFATLRPASPRACFAAVDVNDGQLLYLTLSSGTREPLTPQDTMCAMLPRIAGTALRVLAG